MAMRVAVPNWLKVRRRMPVMDRVGREAVLGLEEPEDEALPRGPHGGAMVALCAPQVSFVVGHPGAAERMSVFEDLGFHFQSRYVGMAEIASAMNPVSIELQSVDELVALQRRVGCPFRLEDGVLEITT